MTDEVTPTREQCVEWLNAMIEMRAPDLPPFMRIDAVPKAILSHLRTPRVEAERLEQIKREGYKPESDRARHLLRHAVLSEAVRKHMGEFWVYDVSLLLSRRPSEAADGARGDAKCEACNGTGDSRGIPHPEGVAWNRVDMGCSKCGATGRAPSRRLTGAELGALHAAALCVETWGKNNHMQVAATLRALADRLASSDASEDGAAVGDQP